MNEHVVIALVATRGLEEFLANSLAGLKRVGIDPRIVHVARPDNAADTIDPIATDAGAIIHPFAEFNAPSADLMPLAYVDYGTGPFVAVCWEKVRYIRWLLDRYRHVVYADLDVGWLADPLWYLEGIGNLFPLAFQTEALRKFPPMMCWGFLSAKSSDFTLRLLDTMLQDYQSRPPGQQLADDQTTFDAMATKNPGLLQHIYPLPEGLFVNGLGYRNLLNEPAAATPLQGKLEPFVFHANWTVGIENKKKLMAQTGTWLPGA